VAWTEQVTNPENAPIRNIELTDDHRVVSRPCLNP
jgi:hypothetical protein